MDRIGVFEAYKQALASALGAAGEKGPVPILLWHFIPVPGPGLSPGDSAVASPDCRVSQYHQR